jgi:adenine phosphoribosyltransferase
LKIASFNLLGDTELVEKLSEEMEKKIKKIEFDYLVGPEVRVVPLLQSLSQRLGRARHVILRKQIMGYMTSPVTGKTKPTLVLNGPDAKMLRAKKVLVVDDVISTGRTLGVISELMESVGAEVVGVVAVLKQGEGTLESKVPFSYLGKLPLFTS